MTQRHSPPFLQSHSSPPRPPPRDTSQTTRAVVNGDAAASALNAPNASNAVISASDLPAMERHSTATSIGHSPSSGTTGGTGQSGSARLELSSAPITGQRALGKRPRHGTPGQGSLDVPLFEPCISCDPQCKLATASSIEPSQNMNQEDHVSDSATVPIAKPRKKRVKLSDRLEEMTAILKVNKDAIEVKCRCGSTKHSRISHSQCPLNPRLILEKRVRDIRAEGRLLHPVSRARHAELCEAYVFELAQGIKGRMLGVKAKCMTFLHPYHHSIEMSKLHQLALKHFAPVMQFLLYDTECVLEQLGRAQNLPWMVVDLIRSYTFGFGRVGERAGMWDPAKFDKATNADFGTSEKERKEFSSRLKRYIRCPEPFKPSIRSNEALKIVIPVIDDLTPDIESLISAIKKIEGDWPNTVTKIQRILGIVPVDVTKPHTLVIRVTEVDGFGRGVIGAVEVPNNGCISMMIDAIQQLPQTNRIDIRGCSDICIHIRDEEATRKRYSILKYRQEYLVRANPYDRENAAVIEQLNHLDDTHPRLIIVKLSAIKKSHPIERRNPNGGDDPDVVKNVYDNVNQKWIPNPDLYKSEDVKKLPRFRKKVLGSRSALRRLVLEESMEPFGEFRRQHGYTHIATSCAIEDVLPTMVESKQPSALSMASTNIRRVSHQPLPSVKATLEFNRVGLPGSAGCSTYELAIMERTARLPDSAYPRKTRLRPPSLW